MPVGDITGWTQVFAEDFTDDAAIGDFNSVYGTRFFIYPAGWPDTTHHGQYQPAKTLSAHDSCLDIYLHTETGIHMSGAMIPILPGVPAQKGTLYSRFSIRFSCTSAYGYKWVPLYWPDSGNWPHDGEIDGPEASLDQHIGAYMHRMNATSGSDQDAYSTGVEMSSGWHIWTTEWSAGDVKYYLDGVLIGHSTSRVPSTPMHLVLQSETSTDGETPTDTSWAHVLVDWVCVYDYAP